MKPLWLVGGLLSAAQAAEGPVTITSFDMFNAPGQYYRAYAYVGDSGYNVTGKLKEASSERQTWNFSDGPRDDVFRFDYLTPQEAGSSAALFPLAKLVERKHVESEVTGEQDAFMFLDQQVGVGRMNYGFYDPGAVGPLGFDDPAGVFDPPLLDFPESITYGTTWSVGTTWANSTSEVVPLKITYSATAEADAWGVVILPTPLGFMDCIRVNELVATTYEFTFPDLSDPEDPLGAGAGSEPIVLGPYYVRNLYWFAKDRGIVVQVTSKQSDSAPPPDQFGTAAQFVRMFETNHPKGSRNPLPVEDLVITPGDGLVLISWSKPLNAATFRVEHTATPWEQGSWQELTTTSQDSVIDDLVHGEDRFYRVVSLP